MLMGWGPFRFTVPNYSVEQLTRQVGSRVESQPVIGAKPPTQLLGPDEESITLESTFHPDHLNRNGLVQLAAVQMAVNQQVPHMLVHVGGRVFGRWVARSLEQKQVGFGPSGTPQTVTVSMTMIAYVGNLGF